MNVVILSKTQEKCLHQKTFKMKRPCAAKIITGAADYNNDTRNDSQNYGVRLRIWNAERTFTR